jgi:WD40 repeat protein
LEFYDPVSVSAPHLYVTALPFAPKYSWISQICNNVASVVKGKDEDWPAYVRTTKLDFDIRCVTLSPDGRFVAAAGSDNCIQILDAATGILCRQPFKEHTMPVKKHTMDVLCIAFSPDGQYLASGSQDKGTRIWDLKDGTVFARLDGSHGHSDAVFCVAFSPNGLTIASGSRDGRICIWPFTDVGRCFFTDDHKDTIRAIAFSPDGRFVASGSHNKSVRIYTISDGKITLQLLGHHEGRVLSIAFLADGRLVSGSEDRVIRLWNMDTGTQSNIRLSENNASTALIRARPIYEFTTSYNSATFRPLPPSRPKDSITSFAFSPDGRFVVSGSLGHDIRIWDMGTGAAILDPLRGHSARISSPAISPNSESMVSGSFDKRICLWDVKTLFEALEDPAATIHVSSPSNNDCKSSDGRPARPIAESKDLIPLPPACLFGEQVDFDALTRSAPAGRQLLPDGWMRDARKNLVIWIPPQYREHLLCEVQTRANTKPVTLSRLVAIDYETLPHGTSWMQLSGEFRSPSPL